MRLKTHPAGWAGATYPVLSGGGRQVEFRKVGFEFVSAFKHLDETTCETGSGRTVDCIMVEAESNIQVFADLYAAINNARLLDHAAKQHAEGMETAGADAPATAGSEHHPHGSDYGGANALPEQAWALLDPPVGDAAQLLRYVGKPAGEPREPPVAFWIGLGGAEVLVNFEVALPVRGADNVGHYGLHAGHRHRRR